MIAMALLEIAPSRDTVTDAWNRHCIFSIKEYYSTKMSIKTETIKR
jgi:hypothetical protein